MLPAVPERGDASLVVPAATAELLARDPSRFPVTGGIRFDIRPGLAPGESVSDVLLVFLPLERLKIRERERPTRLGISRRAAIRVTRLPGA